MGLHVFCLVINVTCSNLIKNRFLILQFCHIKLWEQIFNGLHVLFIHVFQWDPGVRVLPAVQPSNLRSPPAICGHPGPDSVPAPDPPRTAVSLLQEGCNKRHHQVSVTGICTWNLCFVRSGFEQPVFVHSAGWPFLHLHPMNFSSLWH